jgi:hypothetical protein
MIVNGNEKIKILILPILSKEIYYYGALNYTIFHPEKRFPLFLYNRGILKD